MYNKIQRHYKVRYVSHNVMLLLQVCLCLVRGLISEGFCQWAGKEFTLKTKIVRNKAHFLFHSPTSSSCSKFESSTTDLRVDVLQDYAMSLSLER